MSQSLAKALQMMISMGGEDKSLEQLAADLDVHKSTALRLLRTLEDERFVQHDSQHRYRLGTRLFELANQALEQRAVRTVAHPHLAELNKDIGQTVHLAVFESGQAIYIDKFDSRHAVRMYSRIGLPAPLHCTAVGKVLVSSMPLAEQQRIADGIDYVKMTDRTILTAADYLAELKLVAQQGYAEDHEEHETFVNCVGVPVRDGTGAVVAAMSVSVPNIVLDHQGVLALLPVVRETADVISADLGWHSTTTRKAML
ncbi:MAG: IclR family transcriptional regulator [Nakamurella sp.]